MFEGKAKQTIKRALVQAGRDLHEQPLRHINDRMTVRIFNRFSVTLIDTV